MSYDEHLITQAGGDGDEMPAPRKIAVDLEKSAWLEYNREVVVELCHNNHQSTSLKLSREEAWQLLGELAYFLERIKP